MKITTKQLSPEVAVLARFFVTEIIEWSAASNDDDWPGALDYIHTTALKLKELL